MSEKKKIRSAYVVIDPNNKVRARRSNQCNATAWYPRRNLFKIALMAALILNLCVARGQHAERRATVWGTPTNEPMLAKDEPMLVEDEPMLVEVGIKVDQDGNLLIEDGTIFTDGTNWYRWTVGAGVVCLGAAGTYAAVHYGIPAMVYNAAT